MNLCQIYALKNIGKSQQVIAQKIGINQSIVSRGLQTIRANEVNVLNKHECCVVTAVKIVRRQVK